MLKTLTTLFASLISFYSVARRVYESEKWGVAVNPNGEIVNLFSLSHGHGSKALLVATAHGAYKLDCFDTNLPKFYKEHGFEETGRAPNFIVGEPDVVFMRLKEKE